MTAFKQVMQRATWLASLAYAAGFKRVGRAYLVDAILAVALDPSAEVIMTGPLPRTSASTRLARSASTR
jgi:hypothetical protein